VRRIDFPNGEPVRPGELPEVLWFGPDGRPKDWKSNCPSLSCFFAASPVDVRRPPSRHVFLMMHSGGQPREFTIPTLPQPVSWRVFLDTRQASPDDIFPDFEGPPLSTSRRVRLVSHSMMALISTE
jgi:glycogen operon protein